MNNFISSLVCAYIGVYASTVEKGVGAVGPEGTIYNVSYGETMPAAAYRSLEPLHFLDRYLIRRNYWFDRSQKFDYGPLPSDSSGE